MNIAVAWGQDPRETGGTAGLDAGTVVLNAATLDASKSSVLVVDHNDNDRTNLWDTLEHTIQIFSEGAVPILANMVKVCDILPAEVDYVLNSS